MGKCAYHKCSKKISEEKCLCDKHWGALPFILQEKVIEGNCVGVGSDAFIEALLEACAWLDNPKAPWESFEG